MASWAVSALVESMPGQVVRVTSLRAARRIRYLLSRSGHGRIPRIALMAYGQTRLANQNRPASGAASTLASVAGMTSMQPRGGLWFRRTALSCRVGYQATRQEQGHGDRRAGRGVAVGAGCVEMACDRAPAVSGLPRVRPLSGFVTRR
jgi:hypothetical protein